MKTKMVIPGLSVITLIMAVTLTSYIFYKNKKEQNFSCIASLVQHHKDVTFYLSMNFMFKKNYGIVSMNGQAYAEGKHIGVFNRKIFFSYASDDEFYPLLSQKIIKYPDDNISSEWLRWYFPNFYHSIQQEVYLNISHQENGYHVFVTEMIPFLVCRDINRADR